MPKSFMQSARARGARSAVAPSWLRRRASRFSDPHSLAGGRADCLAWLRDADDGRRQVDFSEACTDHGLVDGWYGTGARCCRGVCQAGEG